MDVTYENYANIRDSKGLRDSEVSKRAGIPQATFSEWKKGKAVPKMDKMMKIADALEIGYFELVGPVGLFSAYNPNKPVPHLNGMLDNEISDFDKRLLKLYHNATPDAQKSVMTLLENSQKDASKSSKEA